jgi:nucleoside-diphosphate-sugar epimerase
VKSVLPGPTAMRASSNVASVAPRVAPANPLAGDLDMILGHTREVWEELRGKRLFITGGTGFFGCWLLESFVWACDRLDLGAEAVVLTRRPEAFHSKAPHLAGHAAVKLLEGNVRSFAFPAGGFSHIIHAATESSTSLNDDDPVRMIDTIVEGTHRVLDFARECRAQKLLFTSSGAVYGQQPAAMTHVAEDYPGAPNTMDPRSAYGEGKRLAELLCSLHARRFGLEVKIARCFAFVGPYLPLDVHFAIGNFIRDALTGRPINVQGDGTPYRSYLYAADLVAWLWTILCQGESCRPYNVGSEEDLAIAQLAKKIALGVGNGKFTIARAANPDEPIRRYVPSTRRARENLKLHAWTPLSEAVRRTVNYRFQACKAAEPH